MDDADQDEFTGLGSALGRLKRDADRRRGVDSTDVDEIFTAADGELPDWWMCSSCGIFLKEEYTRCTRCREERY